MKSIRDIAKQLGVPWSLLQVHALMGSFACRCEKGVGDVGVEIELTIVDSSGVAVNVSSASTKQIIFRYNATTSFTGTAASVTDGSNGKIKYTTTGSDFTAAGVWSAQARIITPTKDFRTSITTFAVGAQL